AQGVAGFERLEGQFTDEAPYAFRLDAIENHQQEHAQRHGHGDVGVGGGHDAEIGFVGGPAEERDHDPLEGQRDDVHGDQVQEVHHEHPAEDHQRQRRDQLAFTVKRIAHLGIDEPNDDFDEIDEPGRHTGTGFASGEPEQQAHNDAKP